MQIPPYKYPDATDLVLDTMERWALGKLSTSAAVRGAGWHYDPAPGKDYRMYWCLKWHMHYS